MVFGVRDPDGHDANRIADALGHRARVTSVDDAIAAGNPVVLAVPGDVAPELADSYSDRPTDRHGGTSGDGGQGFQYGRGGVVP
ncbi:MAG: hypothetical protein ABEH65_05040 [Halobacteriales archaeon]